MRKIVMEAMIDTFETTLDVTNKKARKLAEEYIDYVLEEMWEEFDRTVESIMFDKESCNDYN